MVGPKLDARSYTILLLVAITMLLSLNLLAQRTAPGPVGTTDTYSEAASSAQVASATRDVAAANREIARSIDRLAAAVGKLEMKVNVDAAGGTGGASQAAPGASLEAPADLDPDAEIPYEGTLNIQ